MNWRVEFAEEFEPEFQSFHRDVQTAIMRTLPALEQHGPELGRPHVDTLKGSRHPNMKELRFRAPSGQWRLAFAFDPARQAILLVAGNKSGLSPQRFYRSLVRTADARFTRHLHQLSSETRE